VVVVTAFVYTQLIVLGNLFGVAEKMKISVIIHVYVLVFLVVLVLHVLLVLVLQELVRVELYRHIDISNLYRDHHLQLSTSPKLQIIVVLVKHK
jgi:predicted lysophospholipase L1 biosynthesis ABC-type transport system permease subunit